MFNRVMTHGRSLKAACLVLAALCAGPLSSVASADVYLYSEVWPADDTDGNGDLELFALGSADSDDRPFTLTSYFRDPNSNQLGWGNQSGWGYREIDHATLVSDSSPQGNYSNVISADQGPEHYGCLVGVLQLIVNTGRYFRVGTPPPGATSANYSRCSPTGDCDVQTVKLSHFRSGGVSTLPPFADIVGFGVDFWLGSVCRVRVATPQSSC
jgi:hypothetical protein